MDFLYECCVSCLSAFVDHILCFLEALESFAWIIYCLCAKVVGLFGLWVKVSLSRSVIRVLGSIFPVYLPTVAGFHFPL